MDGEQNGTQEQQGAQQEQGQQQTAQQPQQETQQAEGGNGSTKAAAESFEAQLAERDSRIEELEAQIAEAAKNAETADGLRAEIAALKQQSANERIDFTLQLAGVRNVKAARAVLDDYDGDVEKLREAEPWMFAAHAKAEGATGKTGLPNAGAAKDPDKQMRHWREVAGLTDDGKSEE